MFVKNKYKFSPSSLSGFPYAAHLALRTCKCIGTLMPSPGCTTVLATPMML